MSKSDPPAIPEAPAAEIVDRTVRIMAVPISTLMPSVLTAASVRTEIVTFALLTVDWL